MSEIGYIMDGHIPGREQLKGLALDKVFAEPSEAAPDQYFECEAYLREGDTLHIHSVDIIGSSPSSLYTNLEKLVIKKGVRVKFHKEEITISNDKDNLISRFLLKSLEAHSAMDWTFFKGGW